MPITDMPLEALQTYTPDVTEPDDFDAFWRRTLAEAREYPLEPHFQRVDFSLTTVDVFDASFAGYGGQRIKGWFMLPAGTQEPLPCIVEYIGYGGGRSFPTDWLAFPSAGFAYLVMDTRGQGSASLRGDTPDKPDGGNPAFPGFMTRGILEPDTYYYRRLIVDAVRAVDVMRSHPLVDTEHMAVTGQSQGGGLTIAVSGLRDDLKLAMPDVPFLCHYERALEIAATGPYLEVAGYMGVHRGSVAQVLHTLSYFDGVHFAARMTAPTLFSTALMDTTCPPSTVYAAYNNVPSEKQINVYRYNDHVGGGSYQIMEKIRFARARLLE